MLGIDIGHYSLKVVKLQERRLIGLQEETYAKARNNEERQAGTGEMLRKAVQDLGVRGESAWAAVGDPSIITHIKKYPALEDAELRGAMRLEAEQFVSRDWSEMDYDCQVLETLQDGDLRMLFVAAPKELSDRVAEPIREAGLYPIGISPSSLALATAFRAGAAGDANPDSGNNGFSVLVNVGSVNTAIALLKDGRIEALREVLFGGNDITTAIMRDLQTDFAEAEKMKKGLLPDSETDTDIAACMDMALKPLLQHISITLGHLYRGGKNGGVFFLAGGGCRAPGLADSIEGRFGMPVRFINPFQALTTECELEGDDAALSDYAVALGCALIGEGGDADE